MGEQENLSKRQKEKEVKDTDENHLTRRFHVPIILFISIIFIVMSAVYFSGAGTGGEQEMPEHIDILLYENIGISPDEYKIGGSTQILSRDEMVDAVRSGVILKQHETNAFLGELELSDAVNGFNKRATSFTLLRKGVEERTLVEIRFKAEQDVADLKIIESIPKDTVKEDEIMLTAGGVIVEKDPILMFSYKDVKEGDVLKAAYVIMKKTDSLNTMTFPAEKKKTVAAKEISICGDGRCVIGENYLTCCEDCGCLPGFVCERNACVASEKNECQDSGDCDDGDPSTVDSCIGRPKTCHHEQMIVCLSDDGQCPEGCTAAEDNDCVEKSVEELPEPEINKAPIIESIDMTPTTLKIDDEFVIEATVNDAENDFLTVWLEVVELAESHDEIGEMFDDGDYGDRLADDRIYTIAGYISDYYLTGTYHLTVHAKDTAGNTDKKTILFEVID